MKRLFFLFFILFFILACFACAQKLENSESGEGIATIYNRSQIGDKNPYFTCNVFADQTFRGKIWSEPKSPYKDCFFLNIDKIPNDFLKNEDLFLQIYPFHEKNDGFEYGPSLTIKTFEKRAEGEKKILMESKIIDTFLIEAELELEPDYFFLDHFFELCELDSKWKGLQLVLYERRQNRENIPLRTTKVLLPPFLIHPEHFKESKGDILAAYHPLRSMSADLKSNPSSYYDFAEELCADTL